MFWDKASFYSFLLNWTWCWSIVATILYHSIQSKNAFLLSGPLVLRVMPVCKKDWCNCQFYSINLWLKVKIRYTMSIYGPRFVVDIEIKWFIESLKDKKDVEKINLLQTIYADEFRIDYGHNRRNCKVWQIDWWWTNDGYRTLHMPLCMADSRV